MNKTQSIYTKYQELITESIKQLRETSQILQNFDENQSTLKYEPHEDDTDKQCIDQIETILNKLQIIAQQKIDLHSKSSKTIKFFKKINLLVKEMKNNFDSELQSIENYSSNLITVLLEKEENVYNHDILLLEEQTRKRKMEFLQRKEQLMKRKSEKITEMILESKPSKQSRQSTSLPTSSERNEIFRRSSLSPTFSNDNRSENNNSRNSTIADTLEIIDMKELIDLKNQEVFIEDFENDEDSSIEISEQSSMVEMDILREENINKIEEWTKLKYNNVIFDTSIDNWTRGNSNFSQKVFGKTNLAFIIQDEKLNEFGCYVKSEINKTDSKIIDTNAFVFSLHSHGRLQHPTRFEMKNKSGEIFCLYNDENPSWLFGIGNSYLFDIGVSKKGINADHCVQSSFDYRGYSNVLIGEKKFIPKRIVVIQLN